MDPWWVIVTALSCFAAGLAIGRHLWHSEVRLWTEDQTRDFVKLKAQAMLDGYEIRRLKHLLDDLGIIDHS